MSREGRFVRLKSLRSTLWGSDPRYMSASGKWPWCLVGCDTKLKAAYARRDMDSSLERYLFRVRHSVPLLVVYFFQSTSTAKMKAEMLMSAVPRHR